MTTKTTVLVLDKADREILLELVCSEMKIKRDRELHAESRGTIMIDGHLKSLTRIAQALTNADIPK